MYRLPVLSSSPTKKAATLKSHFVQKPSKLGVHLGFRSGDGGMEREKRERFLHLLITYLSSISCVPGTELGTRTIQITEAQRLPLGTPSLKEEADRHRQLHMTNCCDEGKNKI